MASQTLSFARAVAPSPKLSRKSTLSSSKRSSIKISASSIPIHIEYCEKWNYLPRDKADAAYPGKFTFTMNDNEILKKTVPEGQGWAIENQAEKPIPNGENALWRKGAFEVLRLDTNELLYSKKETGSHLVDGKPGGALDVFIETKMKDA